MRAMIDKDNAQAVIRSMRLSRYRWKMFTEVLRDIVRNRDYAESVSWRNLWRYVDDADICRAATFVDPERWGFPEARERDDE